MSDNKLNVPMQESNYNIFKEESFDSSDKKNNKRNDQKPSFLNKKKTLEFS